MTDTQLSPHFSLAEMTITEHRTLSNTPGLTEIANLRRLAEFLERVKVALGGKPVMINSAFRSVAVNNSVGGKPTSQHCKGCAADIRVPGMTPDQVCRAIIASGLPFDQLIREFDSWTHVSVPNVAGGTPRGSTLIIDRSGTRAFQ